uniref:Uncharacterized protein n=1 Tax=viral metagenome TaxID=1070528 RepID=A0A6C0H4N8_9ZZZZ
MGKLTTGAIFYRRGVSNDQKNFGRAVQGNYQNIQPTSLYINGGNKPQSLALNIFLYGRA